MFGPIQLNRLMRRSGRLVVGAAAVLALLAVLATAGSASMSMGGHGHPGGHEQMGGHEHGTNAVVLCLALGGCALAVAAAVVAVRRVVGGGAWRLPAAPLPAPAWVPAPQRFLARAGPPPLLQVFRL